MCRQIEKDSDFLEQERIMDYSLLVGLHFREPSHLTPVGNHSSPFHFNRIRVWSSISCLFNYHISFNLFNLQVMAQ